MSQILLNGMIIKSSYRNVEFTKGTLNSVEYDPNYSIIKVTYTPGSRNTDLHYPFITVYKEMDLEVEGKFIMDFNDVTINGIKYYEIVHGLSISQTIVNELVESKVVTQEASGVFILLNQEGLNLTAEAYVELVNSSQEYVYAEVVGDFRVANIPPVNFQRNHKIYDFKNVFPFSNDVIFTDEIIIIDGFLDYMEREYPQYRFKSRPTSYNDDELKDLEENFVPNSTIFYKSNIAPENSQFGNRPLMADEYDTYRQAVMSVDMEFVTDDLNTLMKFREDFIMQREFSNKRNYKFNDTAGKQWDASVYWEGSGGEDVPNPPSLMPELSKLALQAFRMRANIIGTICRYKLKVTEITNVIINQVIANQTITQEISKTEE